MLLSTLQRGALYLAEKAKERYMVLLAALGTDKRGTLRAAPANHPIGILDELAAVALDLLYRHALWEEHVHYILGAAGRLRPAKYTTIVTALHFYLRLHTGSHMT